MLTFLPCLLGWNGKEWVENGVKCKVNFIYFNSHDLVILQASSKSC